jgi:hypothetical protein
VILTLEIGEIEACIQPQAFPTPRYPIMHQSHPFVCQPPCKHINPLYKGVNSFCITIGSIKFVTKHLKKIEGINVFMCNFVVITFKFLSQQHILSFSTD